MTPQATKSKPSTYKKFFSETLKFYADLQKKIDDLVKISDSDITISLYQPAPGPDSKTARAARKAIKMWCDVYKGTFDIMAFAPPTDPNDYKYIKITKDGVKAISNYGAPLRLPPVAFDNPELWVRTMKRLSEIEEETESLEKILK